MAIKTTVTPWLGFNSEAEEAATFYVSVIAGSRLGRVARNPATGAAMVVEFELGGLPVCALNTGQDWKHTTAFSFSVACDTQEELDRVWAALVEGGRELQCAWLTDRFGVSWQIVPSRIGEWMSHPDPAVCGRVMGALMTMVKPDIAALERAFAGE
jgi:predicted 3-demethylubiquinone-9 3-methyltransferase (glyoxalase superfamily)